MNTKDYRHPISIRNKAKVQLELGHDSFVGQSPLTDDLDGKLREHHQQTEKLKRQHEEAERITRELEELNTKKGLFINTQAEITEKLTNSVTLIERELLAMRTEVQQLEQCRETFEIHLNQIVKFNPESWTRENMHGNLDKSLEYMDQAADDYDQAAKYFSSKYSANIFSADSRRGKNTPFGNSSEFMQQMKSGLAFNLPLIAVIVIGLLIYLLK